MNNKYAYSAKDYSALSNLVYKPFVGWILERCSPNISPHALTITGALCVATAWGSMAANRANDALISFLLLAYQIFDSLDGMQARRLGKSSPFGEFLDHSCDGLCGVALYFIAIRSFHFTTIQSILFAPIYWNHFFLAHLEGNLSEQFTFETISGPTDGIFVLATFLLYRAWFGEIIVHHPWVHTAKLIFFIGCAPSLPAKLLCIWKGAKNISFQLTSSIILAFLTSIIFIAELRLPDVDKYAGLVILGYSLNMCANSLQVSLLKLLKHSSVGPTSFFMRSINLTLWLSNIFCVSGARLGFVCLNALVLSCLIAFGFILL